MSNGFLDSDLIDDEPRKQKGGEVISILSADDEAGDTLSREEPYVISNVPPESMAETVRRSGLAYSAGIAFFASVVFMLVIGWGADLLLGTSPWGIVFGIVLGSVIGFVQFFRITSRIFKAEKRSPDPNPLFHGKDLEK
jgi:F0F1-type ATP synthase assembly protein I